MGQFSQIFFRKKSKEKLLRRQNGRRITNASRESDQREEGSQARKRPDYFERKQRRQSTRGPVAARPFHLRRLWLRDFRDHHESPSLRRTAVTVKYSNGNRQI